MEIAPKYDPLKTEDKWYRYWLEYGYFRATPDEREPYCIVIPPPNVTGVLHMGHMLNNTLQDVLVRRARMMGKNTLWVPGTDHASIATEAKVVAMLQEQGISKSSITREQFLEHAWRWKEKHGGIILEQLKKLGVSCDWDRTCFTLDEERSESVIDVFIDLYNKGLIYRGYRMVNWDPQAKTAVSDEEVVHTEEQSKLYYVRYRIENSDEYIGIATTRPETILGDTAVCVNPEDKRYRYLKGKRIIVPMADRPVPIIFDDYVDMEFGTGALKVTPAHDANDYELGIRHNLETIDILNDDGTLSSKAQMFIGEERFTARKMAAKKLEELGALLKTENYVNKVGRSERTGAVIEPKVSVQWFLRMKELAAPALENVENDNIRIYPAKYKNTYRHWMENVRDWCISRQLWWGHRIPAWYIEDSGDFVVAKTGADALKAAIEKTGNKNLTENDLRQDEDVLDTWFSSWLWPITVFDKALKPVNKDIKYYYPTDDLVTAPEILFFWVARMIMAGYEWMGEKPFKNVYLTGIVRDKQGRKMSKQLGNSPDPIDLMKKYGADGVRVGMLLCSPAGNDLLFDESLPEQGRNFGNKIWNAFRLVKGWKVNDKLLQPEAAAAAVAWFGEKLKEAVTLIDAHFSKYRISEALMAVYRLFWEEFSSWYLEAVKPGFGQPADKTTYDATIGFFDDLLRLLHPFMPFITEEIWQLLRERKPGDSIMVAALPVPESFDEAVISYFEKAKEVITAVRSVRQDKNISKKEALELKIKINEKEYTGDFDHVIVKLCGLSGISAVKGKPEGAVSFLVGTTEYYILLGGKVDVTSELTRLQQELDHTSGFLETVIKKLNNERFISNAPAKVVEMEYRKKADAEKKIKAIEEQIGAMRKK